MVNLLKELLQKKSIVLLLILSSLLILVFRANVFTYDPFHPTTMVVSCVQQNTTCSVKDLLLLLGALLLGLGAIGKFKERIQELLEAPLIFSFVPVFIPQLSDPIRKGLRRGRIHPQIYA